MHQAGLVACQPRKRARTTIPAQDLHHRPDLVKRNSTANKPEQKWVGDITYIPTWEGFTYLATVMEAYSWGVGEDESGDGLYCGFEGVVGATVISV